MPSPAFPTESTTLLLDGPAGALETAIDLPEGEVAPLPAIAVVCHPLSTDGGSLHNKVVTMAARAVRELGVATVRFNFRGVGRSEGAFDDGVGELEDLATVVAWVRSQRPEAVLWLIGFSFGAYVSLKASQALQPQVLVSIAPPTGRGWDFAGVQPPPRWLVVQGNDDEIVDPQSVFDWLDSIDAPHTLVRMPDTSHFFHRKLIDLRGAIQHAVKGWLPAAQA